MLRSPRTLKSPALTSSAGAFGSVMATRQNRSRQRHWGGCCGAGHLTRGAPHMAFCSGGRFRCKVQGRRGRCPKRSMYDSGAEITNKT
jgi:hypothetical protein